MAGPAIGVMVIHCETIMVFLVASIALDIGRGAWGHRVTLGGQSRCFKSSLSFIIHVGGFLSLFELRGLCWARNPLGFRFSFVVE